MNNEFTKRFPEWCDDTNGNYQLCLSNDIDSYMSCIALYKIKGYKKATFYDFKGIYYKEDAKITHLIGADIDLVKGKCWGNHVTALKNEKSANLNTICDIRIDNYFDKYAGNTILTILSYYNVDIKQFTEEQQMVLLSIDAMFKGFYSDRFRPIQKHYLNEILEYPELVELIGKMSYSDFSDIIEKYKLYGKIWVNEKGKLQTDINFEGLSELFGMSFFIPKNIRFIKKESYKDTPISLQDVYCNKSQIFSDALTNRNFCKCSIYYNLNQI